LNNGGIYLDLQDIIPLSLGVRVAGGRMSAVVPRNSLIPTRREDNYDTNYDNLVEVTFVVYEGEREMVANNNLLGEFQLSRILAAYL